MDMNIPGHETTYKKVKNHKGEWNIWGQMRKLVWLELGMWTFLCESGQREFGRLMKDEAEEII